MLPIKFASCVYAYFKVFTRGLIHVGCHTLHIDSSKGDETITEEHFKEIDLILSVYLSYLGDKKVKNMYDLVR